jgi:hypothetical protein
MIIHVFQPIFKRELLRHLGTEFLATGQFLWHPQTHDFFDLLKKANDKVRPPLI